MKTHPEKASLTKWTKPGLLENPYSHWTIALADKWFSIWLFAILAFHFWLSAVLPPAEDELYYWTWSQNLQLSYFDHPPMVAYLIALSTLVFGKSVFAVRFFATVLSFLSIVMLVQMSIKKRLLGYLLFCPIFFLGGMVMTPDIPLLFFWTAYLLWLTKLCPALQQWHGDPISRVYHQSPIPYSSWIWGGVLLGLGLLSKYTMALAIPCTFLVLVFRFRWQAWVAGFLLHLAVGIILFSPVIFYNIDQDFAPFLFQWNHAMSQTSWSFSRFFTFIGGQVLMVGALPFLLMVWVIIRSKEFTTNPALLPSFFFFLFPMLFFFYKAMHGPIEANWPLVAYTGFWPIAIFMIVRSSFRKTYKVTIFLCFFPAVAASLLFLVHWHKPFEMVPPHKDRLARMEAYYKLSQQVALDTQNDEKMENSPVFFTDHYQWTSYLRFQGLNAHQLPHSRPSHFTTKEHYVDPCTYDSILMLGKGQPTFECFSKWEVIRTYPLLVRNNEVTTYQLIRYSR